MSTGTTSREGTSGLPPLPPAASHTAFIVGQIRSGLAHLNKTRALDDASYESIERILMSKIKPHRDDIEATEQTCRASGTSEISADTLGKRNAWLRETLEETSLLSDLVDTALSIGVPSAIMGNSQREAIVLLVERSQNAIAKAVTDPKHQQRAQTGAAATARGGLSGLRKGLNAAGLGVQDIAAKRQEAKQRAESRKAEKHESKQIKRELKEERRAFLRQRQADLLAEGSSNVTEPAIRLREDSPPPPINTVHNVTRAAGISNASMEDRSVSASDAVLLDAGEFDEEVGGAMASVACSRLYDYGESDNAVSATTTFSPWPGLLLSSTIVAVSDEPAVKSVNEMHHDPASHGHDPSMSRALPPPKRLETAHPAALRASTGYGSDDQHLERTARPAPAAAQQSAPPSPENIAIQPASVPSGKAPSTPFAHGEIRDVTEAKQKGWARKLGL